MKAQFERLGYRKNVLNELRNGLGPGLLVVASGGVEIEGGLLFQPSSAELVKAGSSDPQSFAGGGRIHLLGVKEP